MGPGVIWEVTVTEMKGGIATGGCGAAGLAVGLSTSFLVSGGAYTEEGAGPSSGMLALKKSSFPFSSGR